MKAVLLNDASVLLNILATDKLREIANSIDRQIAICSAAKEEAKKLRDPTTGEMALVNLTPYIETGALLVLEPENDEEKRLYVEAAAIVDDGEAMSYAIARVRNLELAIDDKKARRLVTEQSRLRMWSTAELLKCWSESGGCSKEELREAIINIETRARYFPANPHVLAAWWTNAKLPA